ncbi:hypothetical protein EMCG_02100 [[Emmonsia] crescens]|uniref:Uncharacterized protein n=1 Tax=[Emmonsia] crescens TaxID=73230 RepID=A0A0G2HZM0_9EURO|nr:hypothetical protein EMCG_02100 [Emmonsia crescens UAMH 3008]
MSTSIPSPTFTSVTKSPEKCHSLSHVQNSYFTPGTPDMTCIRAWTNRGLFWAAYRYEIDLGMDISGGDVGGNVDTAAPIPLSGTRSHTRRRAFLWKPTHHVGVENSMPWKHSPSNYKLVDEEKGEVVSAFANNEFKSWKKKG